jgi:hypothetical protein
MWPRRASRPVPPGPTGAPSSSSTAVWSFSTNVAPPWPTLLPTVPVSDDPSPSATRRLGSSRRIRSRVAADSTAPPDPMTHRLSVAPGVGVGLQFVQQRPGHRVTDDDQHEHGLVPISRQIVGGSNTPSSGITIFPPVNSWWNPSHWDEACISGGVGSATSELSCRRSGSSSGRVMALPIRVTSPPPMAAKKMSSCRHITPLGFPVVPPV